MPQRTPPTTGEAAGRSEMAKSDVLAVLDRMVASVGARADRNRDADLAAAHEARAAVAELIDAAKYALGTRDDAGSC